MKQFIRYCIIALFAVLLLSDAQQSASATSASTDYPHACCFISQSPTVRQAIDHFYTHFSSTLPCLECLDSAQVPGKRTILLPFAYVQMRTLATTLCNQSTQHYSVHPVPDPHIHYVFELRRILI